MSSDFSSSVMEFVPSPYPWFSANPATVFVFAWNRFCGPPQMGHVQSAGNCCRKTSQSRESRKRSQWILAHSCVYLQQHDRVFQLKSLQIFYRQLTENIIPGEMGYSGSPSLLSYLYPHPLHSANPWSITMNFSAARSFATSSSSSCSGKYG